MPNKLLHVDYSQVVSLFDKYVRSSTLDQRQKDFVQAARADLQRLDFLSKSVVDTTNLLIPILPLPSPEQIMETIRADPEFRKKNPELDAWLIANPNPRLVQSSTTAARSSDQPAQDTETGRLEMRLEADTRAFYTTAHTLISTLRKLPNLEQCSCAPINEVRSQLIEHRPAQSVIQETFQYGDVTGPQIKGLRRSDQAKTTPRDAGFVHNSQALMRDLTAALRRALPVAGE